MSRVQEGIGTGWMVAGIWGRNIEDDDMRLPSLVDACRSPVKRNGVASATKPHFGVVSFMSKAASM